jgi:hypothetical protein
MKKFLIQIQPGAATRFNLDDDTLAHLIAREVGRIVAANTSGPEPSVTVIQEEVQESDAVLRYRHAEQRLKAGPDFGPCMCEICNPIPFR